MSSFRDVRCALGTATPSSLCPGFQILNTAFCGDDAWKNNKFCVLQIAKNMCEGHVCIANSKAVSCLMNPFSVTDSSYDIQIKSLDNVRRVLESNASKMKTLDHIDVHDDA
jgi:hypothetical protein